MEVHDMGSLVAAIGEGSEEKTEDVELFGQLRAIVMVRNSFKMFDGEKVIIGDLELDAPLDADHAVTLPAMYNARVRRRVRLVYSRGEEEVRYGLLSLTRRP
jgi:hypothetical protein